MSQALKDAARKEHEKSLVFLRKMDGRAHSSVRESAVSFGRMAGMDDADVVAALLAAGVPEEDVEGAVRFA